LNVLEKSGDILILLVKKDNWKEEGNSKLAFKTRNLTQSSRSRSRE